MLGIVWLLGCAPEAGEVEPGGRPSQAGCTYTAGWPVEGWTGYATQTYDEAERLTRYVEGDVYEGTRIPTLVEEVEYDTVACLSWVSERGYRRRGDESEIEWGSWSSMRCDDGVPLDGAAGGYLEDESEVTDVTYVSDTTVERGLLVKERRVATTDRGTSVESWSWSWVDARPVELRYYDEAYLIETETWDWDADRLVAYTYQDYDDTLSADYVYDAEGRLLQETWYHDGVVSDTVDYTWPEGAWYVSERMTDSNGDGVVDEEYRADCTDVWPYSCEIEVRIYTGLDGEDAVVEGVYEAEWTCPGEDA